MGAQKKTQTKSDVHFESNFQITSEQQQRKKNSQRGSNVKPAHRRTNAAETRWARAAAGCDVGGHSSFPKNKKKERKKSGPFKFRSSAILHPHPHGVFFRRCGRGEKRAQSIPDVELDARGKVDFVRTAGGHIQTPNFLTMKSVTIPRELHDQINTQSAPQPVP